MSDYLPLRFIGRIKSLNSILCNQVSRSFLRPPLADSQEKKTLLNQKGLYLSKNFILSFSQVRVRSRNCIRSFFTFIGRTEINCITIATFLTILKDEPVTTYAFFFYQVVNDCIYLIPASLLLKFVTSAISDYNYFTTWLLRIRSAATASNLLASSLNLTEFFESNAWQCTECLITIQRFVTPTRTC